MDNSRLGAQKQKYVNLAVSVQLQGSGPRAVVRADYRGQTPPATITLPTEDEAFRKDLQTLARVFDPPSKLETPSPAESARVCQAVGQRLFDAILGKEAMEVFAKYREARGKRSLGKEVRLKLTLPAQLAYLPWEFLFDARHGGQSGEFLCLHGCSIVRHLELTQPPRPLGAIHAPLQVLVMAATPEGKGAVNVAEELAHIEQAIRHRAAEQQRSHHVEVVEHGTFRKLHDLMDDPGRRWEIFHFIGHGAYDPHRGAGVVFLEDDGGKIDRVTATQLRRVLSPHLRLVVLNSCEGAAANDFDLFSSTAAGLMAEGVPAVLAMQYPISNPAAARFSDTFYDRLFRGLPVDAAVSAARKQLAGDADSYEWATPVLYLRARGDVAFPVLEAEIAVQAGPPADWTAADNPDAPDIDEPSEPDAPRPEDQRVHEIELRVQEISAAAMGLDVSEIDWCRPLYDISAANAAAGQLDQMAGEDLVQHVVDCVEAEYSVRIGQVLSTWAGQSTWEQTVPLVYASDVAVAVVAAEEQAQQERDDILWTVRAIVSRALHISLDLLDSSQPLHELVEPDQASDLLWGIVLDLEDHFGVAIAETIEHLTATECWDDAVYEMCMRDLAGAVRLKLEERG
jgi:hypothetical protein